MVRSDPEVCGWSYLTARRQRSGDEGDFEKVERKRPTKMIKTRLPFQKAQLFSLKRRLTTLITQLFVIELSDL